ncbi:MAG: hypothetical protein OXC00_02735 [Acidimicrobiaceae bacterium]|nr:hypothetical protein [Acidimicrobiaceae bacterium]
MAAALVAAALSMLAAAPALAADGIGGSSVSAELSDSVRVVRSAQSEVDADPDSGSDRRLVDRESSERVDAVVIALWTIAGAMTVMLGLFLWHTSPRRRLRLAASHSEELSEEAEGGVEPAEDGAGEDESREDSSTRDLGGRVREALLRLRSRVARQQDSEPAGDDSQQESDGESDGESEDESAVWKFSEENGDQRSV